MKTFFKFIFSVCLLGILVFGVYFYLSSKDTLKIKTSNGVISYHVELALTPEQQRIGLMNRTSLQQKSGMLFIFNSPRVARMWMKNTLIPLDIVFFDKDGHIIYIRENARPLDTTVISSFLPAAGVLEINAGEAKKYGIKNDSIVDLSSIQ